MCKGFFSPPPLHSPLMVLLKDSVFVLFSILCIYQNLPLCISESFSGCFPWTLAVSPSLLLGLLPKLVAGLGKQLHIAWWGDKPSSLSLGRGCPCELAGLERFYHAGRILLPSQDHHSALWRVNNDCSHFICISIDSLQEYHLLTVCGCSWQNFLYKCSEGPPSPKTLKFQSVL